MDRQTALSAANLIYHIENMEVILQEIEEKEYFEKLDDYLYEEFKAAADMRYNALLKELKELKDV